MCESVKTALSRRDPFLLVTEINLLLASLPHQYYEKNKRNEGFYSSKIFLLFYIIGLDPLAEKSGNPGASDFVINYEEKSWVIEVKVSPNKDKSRKIANDALNQIKEKNYAGAYRDPVSLGLVIDDDTRSVTWWECRGGMGENPDDIINATD
ncbi:MAG: PD-(D/E)XK nuclease domain-containing protein [Deltaproteobacteria bacterium]|nr:PD-(D/E)XK nuclease domain-containing protein [Deltaproteobacteria bacterium]